MQAIKDFFRAFALLPSAWLLSVQFLILILSLLTNDSRPNSAISWSLGVLALVLVAKVIRRSPIYKVVGIILIAGSFTFSISIFLGIVRSPQLHVIANLFEATAYFCAAYGMSCYMFADRYLTKDELFAAGAVFTLMVWGFAFLYSACQIMFPLSFQTTADPAQAKTWLDFLFLSFSIQSGTGLSDIMPLSPAARVIAMLQMFCGVMYLTLIVSRLIALQYIAYLPKDKMNE